LPDEYIPDGGLFALWQPSNIVKSPHDGYYYVLLQRDIRPISRQNSSQGMCVMRTKTLDDPSSWRTWDGQAYTMQFSSLYIDPAIDANKYVCKILDGVQALTYNLTYNTYFGKFIAVAHAMHNVPKNGFYYALSDDLIHWSRLYLLMEGEFAQTTRGAFMAYPSLIDHQNTSLNFDVTGQTPYLYFSRFQSFSLIDVDLVRVPIEFNMK
ncbi:MAG: hypothetical protein OEY93_12105, partial [Anaerolineae bacterium]|nr:hypothetical protein [Anaerolineae bacterium]